MWNNLDRKCSNFFVKIEQYFTKKEPILFNHFFKIGSSRLS
ncbi:hypothetical protein HMPREF0083_05098 [Aneurinibacillus aneurinilyticus ATCC 12856]|uniref:Uncharacterized protein n=1 Tax=Aneurinibacillus aneurinilyticus ATCC 12856 TaxID=649747 RepID=U1WX57_ANEAE|nr:hypothetical protein HMPREF0083_05098 [Aneurinibacillus aneurinilyticus ATCC 12856]